MAPVIRVVERLIAPLRRRVLLMVGRAVVRLVDDAPDRQRMQLEALSGEILDDVERFQQYGFTSCPPLGSDAILLSIGGMRQHPVVIAAEAPQYRKVTDAPGEVVLYTHLDKSRVNPDGDKHFIRLHGVPGRGGEILLRSRIGDITTQIRMRSGRSASLRLECGRSSINISDSGITMRAPRIDRNRVA